MGMASEKDITRRQRKKRKGANMNCYKGICIYRTDNTELCLKDKDMGHKPQKCDIEAEGLHIHKCRYGSVPCEQCYLYIGCTEV